jgi:hypothetical protein
VVDGDALGSQPVPPEEIVVSSMEDVSAMRARYGSKITKAPRFLASWRMPTAFSHALDWLEEKDLDETPRAVA